MELNAYGDSCFVSFLIADVNVSVASSLVSFGGHAVEILLSFPPKIATNVKFRCFKSTQSVFLKGKSKILLSDLNCSQLDLQQNMRYFMVSVHYSSAT